MSSPRSTATREAPLAEITPAPAFPEEQAALAPWAVHVTAGSPLVARVHSASAGTARDPFQQDRERIVQSRAFRRLAGKTQVFTSRSSDHFRSRLTHTIEVAQIARDIARRLGLNEALAETLALVHDIGHPPFGHAGERALDDFLERHGLRFDHNLHALRICEHFEQRQATHRGLDLTLAVREGIIKHSRDYTPEAHPELRPYLLGDRPPLEAQIIDLADEIAYLTADLDDGVESGLLTVAHIRAHVSLFAEAYADAEGQHPGVDEKYLFHEALQRIARTLVDDLVATIRAHLNTLAPASLAAIRAAPERLAHLSPARERQRLEEKRYLLTHLYSCPELTLEHSKAESVIQELFRFWIDAPEELPPGYLDEIATEGLARVVADYIAGMTDAFILQQYAIVKRRIRP